MYIQLDAQKILKTALSVHDRVGERFPESGLHKISGDLISLTRKCISEAHVIPKPMWSLRSLIIFLVALLVSSLVYIFSGINFNQQVGYSDFLQAMDAAMSSLVMIGATILFLVNLEKKYKTRKILESIHSLRALAHVIDMHQLTKDPYLFLFDEHKATNSSPKRKFSLFELSRYFDYCSEMLSLISKVAALYPQYIDDRTVLNTVDDVESLTDGFSRKIWQKINLVNSLQQKRSKAK